MARPILILLITASFAAAAPSDLVDDSSQQVKPAEEESAAFNSIKNQEGSSDDEDAERNPKSGGEIDGWLSQETSHQLTTNSAVISDQATEFSNSKTRSESKDKKSKKGRKHKALFIDYPFVPQISAIPNFGAYDELQGSEERTPGGGGRKHYHESNIYYIRLPPTPYMFVPGLGYVSQPPTYSAGPIRPQIAHVRPQVNPYRPHPVYNPPLNEINPFINLPIDFVSNGKPTSVYQWQSPSYQPTKRPESQITTLDKGPYFFNGRPHSIYLLRPADARPPPVHQALQFPDYQDNSYY